MINVVVHNRLSHINVTNESYKFHSRNLHGTDDKSPKVFSEDSPKTLFINNINIIIINGIKE